MQYLMQSPSASPEWLACNAQMAAATHTSGLSNPTPAHRGRGPFRQSYSLEPYRRNVPWCASCAPIIFLNKFRAANETARTRLADVAMLRQLRNVAET
jgi:hypothetical protein